MKYYLGLGSNLGNRQFYLRQALKMMEQRGLGKIMAKSSLYLTEPVGKKDQNWFLNAVVVLESELAPEELMQALLEIEENLGRKRKKGEKNLPRTIDLDILLADDIIFEGEGVVIPHPRVGERRFVLEPLCEIAQHLIEPHSKKKVSELLKDLKNDKKVIRLDEKL